MAKLPANIDAEKFVIGSVLLDNDFLLGEAGSLKTESFSLDKHQKIWTQILSLSERNEKIDRITVANELQSQNELDSIGGLSYLVTLDDGLPQIPNVDSYVRIVREKHTLRKIVHLGTKAIASSQLEQDPSRKILGDLGKAISRLEISSGSSGKFMTPGEIVENMGGIAKFSTGSIDPGISWGFPSMDEHLLGLQRGCQYLIGGRTGHGKSSYAMCVATNVAKNGEPVSFLSLEMSKEILMTRAICCEAHVPLKMFIKRELMSDQRTAIINAYERLHKLPLYIDDSAGLSIEDAYHRAKESVVKFNARVVVLDHLHKLRWQRDKEGGKQLYRDEYMAFTAASGAFSDLARQFDISTLVLVQFSKMKDKRKPESRPTMDDIRNTAALEQDATGVIFVHRPEMILRGKPELKGVAEIIIAKSRNGSVGNCQFSFKGSYTKFTDERREADVE